MLRDIVEALESKIISKEEYSIAQNEVENLAHNIKSGNNSLIQRCKADFKNLKLYIKEFEESNNLR